MKNVKGKTKKTDFQKDIKEKQPIIYKFIQPVITT